MQLSQFQQTAYRLSIFLLLVYIVYFADYFRHKPCALLSAWWLVLLAHGIRTYCSFSIPKYCMHACYKWLNEVTAFWVVIMTSWNALKFILHVLLSKKLMSHIGKDAINRIQMVINSKLLVKLAEFGKDCALFLYNHVADLRNFDCTFDITP